MALFGGDSKTTSKSVTKTADRRLIAEQGAQVIQSEGGAVTVHYVPDEAFQLAGQAIDTVAGTLGQALATTQANARTEAAQIGEQLVKIGLPVLALIYIFGGKLR